jgi:hypothetical protein
VGRTVPPSEDIQANICSRIVIALLIDAIHLPVRPRRAATAQWRLRISADAAPALGASPLDAEVANHARDGFEVPGGS